MKKAQAEGNKAEPKGKKGETKANKGETKEHPAVHTTKIPGEAVIVTIVPKQFTMTTTKLWSAMKATIAERAVKGAKIKSNTRYRYFEAFKKSIGPEEYSKLFLEDEAEKDTSSKPGEEPLSLENSAKNAEDPSASVPLADPGEETPGEVAGKPETREEKALNALKEAEAEGNTPENQGNKADSQGNKADTKTKKAETKAPPSFRATNIPGEAVIVTIGPKQFTMTTTKLWSAMKATIERWGWAPDISPSDWLDKYLEITLAKYRRIHPSLRLWRTAQKIRVRVRDRNQNSRWFCLCCHFDDRLSYEFSASVGRESTTAPCRPLLS